MWNSSGRPDNLSTPPVSNTTDHFNNNPYSRNSTVGQQHPAVSKAQQNSDPWSWGWDDNGSSSGQGSIGQDESDLWGAQPPSHLHQPPQRQQQQPQFITNPTIPNSSSEFFENIDLKNATTTTSTTNNLFNQPSHQPQYNYSHHPPMQHQQQPFFQQQAPPQPQISTNSSYSYFQFTEPQQTHSMNSTSVINQYPPPSLPQPQPSYNNHATSHFQHQQQQQQPLPPPPAFTTVPPQTQSQQQTQFTKTHTYNQLSSSTPFSQHQMVYSNSNVNSNNLINNNNNNNSISTEVENREIAPPEKIEKNLNVIQTSTSSLPPLSSSSSSIPTTVAVSSKNNNNSNVPENQETVPENEERPPIPDTISSSMSNLRLNSPPSSESTSVSVAPNELQQWNTMPGWENQEVAPRFTVDRDQYLETGHLHPFSSDQSQSQQSSAAVDNDVDVDTNDEGEAAPPPGLHRLVTGQGQTVEQERLVVGSPPPLASNSSGPASLSQRPQVPGHSMQQQSDLSTLPPHPPLGQRMIPGQLRDGDDMERMVLGSSGNSTNANLSSNQQPREQLQINPVSQRTIPSGRSSDMQQSRDRDQPSGDSVSQRTVPGGSSTSSSSAGSNSSYTRVQDLPSEERLVLGRPTVDQGDDRLPPQQSSTGLGHMSSSSTTLMWASGSANTNHQDSITSHPTYSGDSDLVSQQPPRPPSNSNSVVGAEQSRSNSLISDPPPGLHRMVLGHPDNGSRGGSASGDEIFQSGVPPPGLHRMVLGEQQQEQKQPLQPDHQQQQLIVPSQQSQQQSHSHSQGSNVDNEDCDKDRDIDSDTEYRVNRRKKHHRRDFDHSPEYRSEEELDRGANDYRYHRDYRPGRPRDRERGDRRKQQSPDYYRDDDYRDDQRRPGRGGRYYDHYRNRDVYEEDYYYRENRSRPSSRSGGDYPRRPGGSGGPREFMPPRNAYPYYQDQGKRPRLSEVYKSRSLCSPLDFRSPLSQSNSCYSNPGAYQLHYYQLQQQYYEMRRNDPQAYAAWYEQYMAAKYSQPVYHPDDSRTSVLSGRSSATNHHRTSNEKVLMDESGINSSNRGLLSAGGVPGVAPSVSSGDHRVNQEDSVVDSSASQRYTPQLYPRGAHIKGKWSKQGQLVVVSPNYPREGQPPIVEIMQLAFSNIQNDTDPDVLEFLESPGPFIVGVTHKNTVLQYLKKRADQASQNAEKLLYELMQLVIRLNGIVDMTDVADLLMKNFNEDPGAEHDEQQQQPYNDAKQEENNSVIPETSTQQVTDRFRNLLLQGNKLDALEWAMQNKNWGHAFFLASKMDSRSYNNVMLRYANGLPANDPLQTLYQMMSGREPQAATCCADKKWGDWRPHLAMMLSNPSGNPDIDRKSIITLGDSLASRGRLFASHFCYVTAQVEFAFYTDRNAKLVLLGTSHLQPFAQFATCRSIMLTLCYEYAKRLNKKDLTIPALQVYKYLLATRLIDNGKLALASQYLEAIALDMIHRPNRQNRSLALLVAELADQIKMADPALAMISDPNDDPDWLNMLKQILDDTNDTNLQTSSMSHGISTSTVSTSAADPAPLTNQGVGGYAQDQMYYDNSLHAWNQPEPHNLDPMQYSGYPSGQKIEVDDQYHQHQYQQQQPFQQPQQIPMQQQMQVSDVGTGMNADYDNIPNSLQQQQLQPQHQQQQQHQTSTSVTWDPVNSVYTHNWHEQSQAQQQQMVMPTIPAVTTSSVTTTTSAQEQKKASSEKKSNKDESSRRSGKKNKEASSGWFGGIWDKFAFRPKNEMKLPDDKNPPIVWDEKKGKWVNKDGDEEDEAMGVKPPPKASELPGFSNPIPATTVPAPAPISAPAPVPVPDNRLPSSTPMATSTPNSNNAPTGNPPSSTSAAVNKFKMQKGRGMKANYIDVMNPNNNKKSNVPAGVPPPMMDTVSAAAAPVNNFFIPAPVEGNENAPIDFVSPSGPVSYEVSHKPLDQTTEMNYSSSQDVPQFYNPNSFTVS